MLRLLLLLLTLVTAVPASAQAPADSAALTPAQARAALDVLKDPKKRAEVTATLEAIAKATPAPAPPAAPPADTSPPANAPAAAPLVPLAPNSLGAQVLVGAAGVLNHVSSDARNALDTMQSLPALWRWAVFMATEPWARGILLDVAWRLGVVLLCGLGIEFVARRLLRRALAALEGAPRASAGKIPGAEEPAEPPEEPEAPLPPDSPVARAERGETEPPMVNRRRTSAWALLRRVPLVLARLLLDLVPVLGFLVVGHLIAGSAIGGQPNSRLVLLAVVDAYALCVALLAVARMLLSPATPRLRLFDLPDSLAAYLMRWTRRLIVIAVFGYAIAEVGLLLGLSDDAHDAVLKAVGFALHACLAIIVLQKRRSVRRHLRAPRGATGATARLCNALASVWHWIALFFIVAIWLVWAVEIPHGFTSVLHFFVVIALLLIGARLALILLTGMIDRALSVPPGTASRYPGLEARLRVYHPAVSAVLRALIYALCVLGLLQLYGFGGFAWFSDTSLGRRIASALGTIGVTVVLALAVWEAVNAALQGHLARLAKEQQIARSARLRTLLPLLRSALLITILVFAGLTVLSEIGINIAPLLAGAGIVGVAIGFGSQKLVQDLITGIFLLLENAMQVGDNVTVSGLSGTVEALSVRTIRLRAGDGSVHLIPFSSVTTVTNVNRGLGNVPVSVAVDFDEDTDRVAAVLGEIIAGMRAEPDFASKMLSDLQLWGVDKVDGAGATIAGQVVCTDSGRWSVQREFNRRMKKRFQELGIRLFNPTRSVAVTLPAMGPPAERPPADGERERANEQARATD